MTIHTLAPKFLMLAVFAAARLVARAGDQATINASKPASFAARH